MPARLVSSKIILMYMYVLVSDCVATLSADQDDHYKILLPHGSWVKSPVGCPGWFNEESIGCAHPRGIIKAGSSIEQFGNKITLVDLQSKKKKKLPNLDCVIKEFGMVYDDRTAVLTLVGGYTNCSGTIKANRVIFQLSLISTTPSWREMSTKLPYDVNNPMLVNDDEYLYVLGGEGCVTCVRMSKKNPDSWEKLNDLPKEGVPMTGVPKDEVPLGGLPKDEVPMAGVPKDEVPMTGVPKDEVPMAGVPKDEVPMAGVPKDEVPLAGVPKDEVPLAGVPKDEVPLAGVPKDEVPMTGVPKDEVPMAGVPKDEVPLAGVPKDEVPLAGVPKDEVPLAGVPKDEVPMTGVPKDEVPMTGVPKDEVPMAGVPKDEVPLAGVPKDEVPLAGLPKDEVPMAGLPKDEVPMAGLPKDEVPMAGVPKDEVPMAGVPKDEVPMAGLPKDEVPMAGLPKDEVPMAGLPKDEVPMAGLPKDEVPMAGLPKDKETLAKDYSGGLYSGALLYKNKVRVLTRTKYLTLDADHEDITQKRWNIKSYVDLVEKQPISQLTPIVINEKIVASVKRDQVITVECLNDYKRTWEKIALIEHGRIGAGNITSYMYIN